MHSRAEATPTTVDRKTGVAQASGRTPACRDEWCLQFRWVGLARRGRGLLFPHHYRVGGFFGCVNYFGFKFTKRRGGTRTRRRLAHNTGSGFEFQRQGSRRILGIENHLAWEVGMEITSEIARATRQTLESLHRAGVTHLKMSGPVDARLPSWSRYDT